LDELDLEARRGVVERADRSGAAVFVADGPFGDAIVVASGLATWVNGIQVGVRLGLEGPAAPRHPTMVARDMTTLDLVSGGRAILALIGPFTAGTAEAIALCRDMWRTGIAASDGPRYPVAGAMNRPQPRREGGPPIALDLTDGAVPEPALLRLCDFVLVPAGTRPPFSLPPHVGVCLIRRG
jgi:alkanesulfonate monooxygenase SsuD/methylene tetrahydromethanopterin reductase-like flavin-dependent oxidoreductase (luciferase family)